MAVTLRRQRPAELPAVRDVVAAAFDQEVIGDLVVDLQSSSAARPELCFVAEVDGRIAGATMLTRSWVDAPVRLLDVLVLSPLAVLPERHGTGIGSGLVRHALAAAAATPYPLVFLEGAPDYYARFGFRPAIPLGFTKPSVRIPDAAFQVLPLDSYEPWMTGALVYADPFWAHDCVGLRAEDQG